MARLTFLAAAALVAVAAAAAALAAGGPYDRVAGAGTLTFPGFPTPGDTELAQFTVAAVGAPGGPHGTITFRTTTASGEGEIARQTGEVICMTVSGNEARVAARLRESFVYAGGPTIDRVQIRVVDNGPPGQSARDLATVIAIAPTFAGDPCGEGFPADTPLESGNVTVYDAP